VGGLALGILLQIVRRWRVLPDVWMGSAIGLPVLLAGVALALWSVSSAADLDIEHSTKVLDSGPYAFSRNPMYVAWTLIYVGVAFVVNTTWPLVLLPAVLFLTHVTVLREEGDLERRFGADYRDYRGRVRRYL
jgi:protein-S-isoprenylcysteine O-methyltransferase Ste14